VQQEAGMPEALNREALNQSICYARKDWPEGLDGELFSSLEYCNSHHHISTSDPPSFYSPSSPCSCESQALSQIQALLLGIRPKYNRIFARRDFFDFTKLFIKSTVGFVS